MKASKAIEYFEFISKTHSQIEDFSTSRCNLTMFYDGMDGEILMFFVKFRNVFFEDFKIRYDLHRVSLDKIIEYAHEGFLEYFNRSICKDDSLREEYEKVHHSYLLEKRKSILKKIKDDRDS